MAAPAAYAGREQSYLKHCVLRKYLNAWAFKLGTTARNRRVKLWYVDSFAGPWCSNDEQMNDTSVAIGIGALAVVAEDLHKRHLQVDVGALFVEKEPEAYSRLRSYLDAHAGPVDCRAFHGQFGDRVGEIRAALGTDPAFIFIDPKGWTGADMHVVAELLGKPRRDVLINVMYDFINRFRQDPREGVRASLRSFFGLQEQDIDPALSEEGLFALYRAKLKERCGVQFAADLTIQHRLQDRTWYRLVIGGGHPEVIRLFRNIERNIVGDEGGEVRAQAKRLERESRTGQGELAFGPQRDARYGEVNTDGVKRAPDLIRELLCARSPRRYIEIWPTVLEELHISQAQCNEAVSELRRAGVVSIVGAAPRQRVPEDDDLVELKAP